MKLIVGLGNPGRKYEQTRHNIGFMIAAKVASLAGAGASKVRFEGEVAEGSLPNSGGRAEKLVILWPQTFMNASGQSVRKACDFYKLPPEDLLVISDDLNLKTGRVRIRPAGSAGGQKGMADIIRHLGTDNFARLRIGIDRPPENWTVTDYVLGKFNKDETDKIETALERATQAAISWVSDGIGPTMTRFNADPTAPKPEKSKPEKSKQKKRTAAEPAETDTTNPESKTD
jgi:PTH1 family peptidyl-tRNA hydrolase